MDRVFDALASAHRREIVFALGLRPHTISELAQIRGLTLSAIHRHIRILEDSGLARRRKVGRTNVLSLDRRALLALQGWLSSSTPTGGPTPRASTTTAPTSSEVPIPESGADAMKKFMYLYQGAWE